MSAPALWDFHLNNVATAARQEYPGTSPHMPGNMAEIRPLAEFTLNVRYMARTTATGSASVSEEPKIFGLPPPESPDSDTPRARPSRIHMLQMRFSFFQRLDTTVNRIVRCGKSRFS